MLLAAFHSVIQRWFAETLGTPTPAQAQGWRAIREGRHTLIAAPTGSGKTLAAFLTALDDLFVEGLSHPLAAEVRVVYVSPLKALSADIHKNLAEPRRGMQRIAAELGVEAPRITAAVRTGDTPSSERTSMLKTPPHILVTTPESLYLLLTAERSREMLRTVRTVIVDEIHAVIGTRRGSHLALSLERLQDVARVPLHRIGLSATQKPIEDVARWLAPGADVAIIDEGHRRVMDLTLEMPRSPLDTVMSNEVWEEYYERLTRLIGEHKTTLVFVNTRRMAERVARQLSDRLGDDAVTAHHGSLSKDKRLDAETRLKGGRLKALVATASLELGIDIGHVDLVCQIGSPHRIATLLQRVGRSGHTVSGTPKGRVFPVSRDDLVECAALLRAVRRGELDRILEQDAPLDVLAQQIVAETSCRDYSEDELFGLVRRAWPYRALAREDFDKVLAMTADGFATKRGRRSALVHRDEVNGNVRGRRGSRMLAITSGGAIPELADYRVVLEGEETFIGTLNEDFAIESNAGDIFQLGNASWQITQVLPGTVRVADAHGAPPTIPFWLGEAPARSDELSRALSDLRADFLEHLEYLELRSTGGGREMNAKGPPDGGSRPPHQRLPASTPITAEVEARSDPSPCPLPEGEGSLLRRRLGASKFQRNGVAGLVSQQAVPPPAPVSESGALQPSPSGRGQGEGSDVTHSSAVIGAGARNADVPLQGPYPEREGRDCLALEFGPCETGGEGGEPSPAGRGQGEGKGEGSDVTHSSAVIGAGARNADMPLQGPSPERVGRDCLAPEFGRCDTRAEGVEPSPSGRGQGEGSDVTHSSAVIGAGARDADVPLQGPSPERVDRDRLALEFGPCEASGEGGEPSPAGRGQGEGSDVTHSSVIGAEARDADGGPDWLIHETNIPRAAAEEIAAYLTESQKALGGVLPTQDTLVLERFFDESGGMQLVLHAPFGSRINKAWGLALRKRFCRQFNFELQAAATEDALLLSLGPQHSFPLADVFRYLHPATARDILVQAFLDAPVFQTRWRWNTTISLAVPRNRNGRKVAPQLQRMIADDLMAAAFPDAAACFENIPGDRQIPDHPLVQQVVRDCLEEAMDFEGLARVLTRIHAGELQLVACDTTEPSPLSHDILNARPYQFLDDAPLEERRTQAVHTRRTSSNDLGALDAAAIARVRDEERPDPRDADELHDALLTAGFLTESDAESIDGSLFQKLVATRRAGRVGAVWVAAERLPEWLAIHPTPIAGFAAPPSRAARIWTAEEALVELLRGRLAIIGPTTAGLLAHTMSVDVAAVEAALVALESEGAVLRGSFTPDYRALSVTEWCDRRLLARIHRYTLNRLRAEIEPVSAADFMRFLFAWQHVTPIHRLAGADGLQQALTQLDGFEVAAAAWEKSVLPLRVERYEPSMLDTLSLTGEVGWARLSPPSGAMPVGATPIALFLRDHAAAWLSLRDAHDVVLSEPAQRVLDALRTRGASFARDLGHADVEQALAELVGAGLVTSDGFAGLRSLVGTSTNARLAGRWSPLAGEVPREEAVEAQAHALLRRYGVVCRRLLAREANVAPWRELARVYRRLEARGDLRGGRFVHGLSGEQFALPSAVQQMREIRRTPPDHRVLVISAADPLNLTGILTTSERVRSVASTRIAWRNGVAVSVMEGDMLRPLIEIEEPAAMEIAAALAGRRVAVAAGWVGR